MLTRVKRAPSLVPVLLALVTCTRHAAPQTQGGRSHRVADPVVARSSSSPPPIADAATEFAATWTEVRPGLAWRRAVTSDEGHALDWIVVRFDLARVVPVAEHAPGDRLDGLFGDRAVVFAVDAGFFTEDLRPAGVLASRGAQLGGYDSHGGSGLVVVRGGHAEMLDASTARATEPGIDLAIQCGPRLVENDGSVGIRRDDGRRFARTAICLRDSGRTLDVIATWWRDEPLRGPGLLPFAQRLAVPSPVGDARGCEAALNLDGGPSTGIYVRGESRATHGAIGPVPFALTVREPIASTAGR
jgi:hypothetical protein